MNKITPPITTLVLALLAGSAEAATYTVTNTNDSGPGSLRQAINDANINPGTDFINFNIPGSGVHTIFPTTPLPWLIGVTSVNGSTQPGFGGTPLIEIAGDLAGAGAVGLQIFNNSSQVGWLTINGFDSHGIRISGTGNASIVGCWVGLNNTGTATTYPNGGEGILIDNSPNNSIGGTSTSLRNVVSGNTAAGIRVQGATSTGNLIRGNYVGTNALGTAGLGNNFHGIYLVDDADDNTVGGTTTGAGNLVSANANNNIRVQDCGNTGSRVQGNLVGLNASGNATLTTVSSGIEIVRSRNCLVGGTTSGARNVVAGHSWYGIRASTYSEGTVIQGNYVGTDVTGQVALGGHGFSAIGTFNVGNILIGGTTPGARNVVSGNSDDGISFTGSNDSTNPTPVTVHGNYIGVAADGVTPLGNGGAGVHVDRRNNHRVGGTASGEGNRIAYNVGCGVLVSFSPLQSRISGNSIYSNGGLGIDLDPVGSTCDGVTPNDLGDPDTGPNNLQNFPVLSSAVGDSVSSLTVTGTLNSLPFTSYQIELFGNVACDASGNGEGRY